MIVIRLLRLYIFLVIDLSFVIDKLLTFVTVFKCFPLLRRNSVIDIVYMRDLSETVR